MIEFKDVAFQYEQGSSKGKIENINLTIHDGEGLSRIITKERLPGRRL